MVLLLARVAEKVTSVRSGRNSRELESVREQGRRSLVKVNCKYKYIVEKTSPYFIILNNAIIGKILRMLNPTKTRQRISSVEKKFWWRHKSENLFRWYQYFSPVFLESFPMH